MQEAIATTQRLSTVQNMPIFNMYERQRAHGHKMAYKVLTACGSAAASASTAKSKLEQNMPDYGIPKHELNIEIVRLGELESHIESADVAVLMTGSSKDIDTDVPMVKGVPLMTGVGEDEVYEQVAEHLQRQ